MKRTIIIGLIAWGFIFLLLIGVIAGMLFHGKHAGSIYYQHVGSRWIDIWIRKDQTTGSQVLSVMTLPGRFVLMSSASSVDKPPGIETATFSTIYDEASGLICVYDNDDCGFILIVHDISGMEVLGYRNILEDDFWLEKYEFLKSKHPEIPDAQKFRVNASVESQ